MNSINIFSKEKNKKNVLIFGSKGNLGKRVISELKSNRKINILSTSRKSNDTSFNFDIKDENNKLKKIIEEAKPYAIINCIALTNVDQCEVNKENASLVNSIFPRNLVDVISKTPIKPKLVHISTDQLYESNFWSEIGQENPINIYSKSKLAGDKYVLNYPKSTILRTNFLWNDDHNSPVNWLIKKSLKKDEFILFEDVFYNPLEIRFLASLIHKIIFKDLYGIYNIGSRDFLSKAEVFSRIALILNLNIKNAKIQSIDNIKLKAPRPKNMTIDIKKFEKDFDIKLPTMQETISKLLN